jgi:tetratricopeptide (TPR) repeat protein
MKIFTAVWAYYVITLLPVIGIIQIGEQAAADRYSYMPGIGPFFLIGSGISYAWYKHYSSERLAYFCKKIILFIIILITLTLSILTVKQTKIWTDSITLWSYELKGYPDFWLGYHNRAHAYTTLEEYEHASKDIDKAIFYNPKYPQSYFLRAVNHIGLGDYHRALTDLDKAVKLDPQFADAYYIRSKVYIKLENYQMALLDLDRAMELKTQFAAEAYREKQEIYKKLSD